MLFGSKKIVGLDIGSSSLKMAELEVGMKGTKLLSFGMMPTPIATVNNGDIADPNSLGAVIKSLGNEIRTRRKYIATALFGTAVIVKRISIPRVDLKLVSEQIKWEAEQYIPFDLNSIMLSYHLINPKGTSENLDILLIAAQKEVVSGYSTAVSNAGFNLGVLDVSGFAMANTFELNYGIPKGQTVGLLDFGSNVTNFIVVHNGEVVFSRDMSVGGQSYTNDIQRELGLSLDEAEAMKLSVANGQPAPDEIHSVISASNDVIVEEIRNSFDFFSGSSGGISITQCYFTGGASRTSGLIGQLAQATSISFEPLNPFLKVESGNKSIQPDYFDRIAPFCVCAIGLALRAMGDE